MVFKTLTIVYDGHCRFCVRSLKIVRVLDLFGALRFFDSHDPDTYRLFPVLRDANVDDAMYTLADSEPRYAGFFAFRRLLWSSPLTWLLILLFYFPGSSFIGPRIYAWVSRNRSKLGCRTEICDLPDSAKPGVGA
jgi:predicted DCC family thiol-disulfide oxidoreductase YuxK